MNETMSLFLVATVLAIGGVGLYMFKFSDDNDNNGSSESYKDDDYNDYNDDSEYDDDEIFEQPKTRSKGSKTKRSRKSSGTKRRI